MAQPWWEERVPPLSRRELFGAPLGVAPQLQPLEGMLLRRSTDIYPKELARDMREFFNNLLVPGFEAPVNPCAVRAESLSRDPHSDVLEESQGEAAGERTRPVRRLPERLAGKLCSAERRTPHAGTGVLPRPSPKPWPRSALFENDLREML